MISRRAFDLRSLFSIDGWLVDGDGDGLADDTRVTLVLRDGVTHDEVMAAAELAARIGHETMGMSPPLAVSARQLSDAHVRRLFLRVDESHDGGASIVLRSDEDVEVTASVPADVAAALRFLARHFPDTPGLEGTFATLDRIGADARLIALELEQGATDIVSARVVASSFATAAPAQATNGLRVDVVSPVGEELATTVAPLADPRGQTALADPSPSTMPIPAEPLDLAYPYRLGGLLQREGYTATRPDVVLTLGSNADDEYFVALVSVAARVGLETSALHLPLTGRRAIRFGEDSRASELVVREDDGQEVLEVHGPAAASWLAFGAPGPIPDSSTDLVQHAQGRSDALPPRQPPSQTVWESTASLPWEVDELRDCLRDDVLPRLSPGEPASIAITISEPRQVREKVRESVLRSLHERGLQGTVVVRPAYKQGLNWLLDEVAPAVTGDPSAAGIRVACRSFGASIDAPWLSPMVLKELRLFDEQAATAMEHDLGKPDGAPPWLDPPLRWLLELYPADELLAAEGINVRLEVDVAQAETYRADILDVNGVVVATHIFEPLWIEQPFLSKFPHLGLAHPPTGGVRAEQGEFVIERRVATDPERIWQHLQDAVLPAVAAELRARHAESWPAVEEPLFATLELEVAASEPDERLAIDEERVSPLEALHEDLHFGPLEFFAAWGETERGTPFLSPGQVVPRIHARSGRGAEVAVRLLVHERPPGSSGTERERERVTRVHVDGSGIPVEIDLASNGKTRTIAIPSAAQANPVENIPTDRPLSDADVEELASGLSVRREVEAFACGATATGRRLVALSALLRGEAAVFSEAKAIAWKPTLLINAGHHGNEPSSTNAVLRLVDTLTGYEGNRRRLLRANVIVLPLENADGAALAHDLAGEHPEWMLHAGRFNSLGFEFRGAYGNPDHPSTESRALPALWQQWLPEVYVDAHGCPSHEWAQPFTGYAPVWPAYWAPRAQLMAYVRYPAGDAYEDQRQLAARLVEHIDEAASRRPDIVTLNERLASRYARYASRWMPDTFPLSRTAGGSVVYVSAATPGSKNWANWSTDFMTVNPEITSLSMITEIPDETVNGPAMERCVEAQLATFEAALDLLAEWDGELERHVRIRADGCIRLIQRPRPLRCTEDLHRGRRDGRATSETEEVSA